MAQLSITQQNARKLYPTAAPEFKVMLEDTFTKAFFSQTILDRVVDVKSACEVLGYDFATLFDECQDKYAEAELSIKIVAEALREGKPAGECFYYPYFYNNGSGFRFLVSLCAYRHAYVGSRLRVDTESKAQHMGKILEKEYIIYLTDPS